MVREAPEYLFMTLASRMLLSRGWWDRTLWIRQKKSSAFILDTNLDCTDLRMFLRTTKQNKKKNDTTIGLRTDIPG